MKKIGILIVLTVLLYSCNSKKIEFQHNLNPAASEVWRMIEYAEKNVKCAEKGKEYSPLYIDELSNLTGLSAKVVDYNCWTGIMYEPTMEDIITWKNWFTEHFSSISYYESKDIDTYLPQVKPILKVEIAKGEFRYSILKYDIDRYAEFAQEIKRN